MPHRGILAARAVGQGQQGGDGLHQPVATHADRVPAARHVPFPASRFQPAKALFNPVSAGIQGGLRLCHGRVGQQYPGLCLAIGLPHNQSAVRRPLALIQAL